jgi:hypothetical protein
MPTNPMGETIQPPPHTPHLQNDQGKILVPYNKSIELQIEIGHQLYKFYKVLNKIYQKL